MKNVVWLYLSSEDVRSLMADVKNRRASTTVTFSCPHWALQVTPGKRSPTVSQLHGEAWVAVQALIHKKDASRIMDDLQAVGATDILLFTLHNTRM